MSDSGLWQALPLSAARAAWDASPLLVVMTEGPEHLLVYQNPASQRLFGPRAPGSPMAQAFPEMGETARLWLDDVYDNGGTREQSNIRPGVLGASGSEVLLTFVVSPVGAPGPGVRGVLICAHDVTHETVAARAARQAALLSDLSERMNEATDPDASLSVLTNAAVPALADLAAVFVGSLPGGPSQPADRSGDTAPRRARPRAISIDAALLQRVGPPPEGDSDQAPTPWDAPLAAGRAVLIDVSGGDLSERSGDAVLAWLRAAGAHNMAVLPLAMAGELAGAVVLLSVQPRPAYTEADLPFLELVAARAASSVAHVRAFRQQWQIAYDLQTALLPRVPQELPGVSVAAHYLAGGGDLEIGGDWWEVSELDGGRVAVGLGDVAGRGIQAAVVMGQVKAAMRAAALARLGPSAVLTLLDQHLAGLGEARSGFDSEGGVRLATAVFGVIDPARDELRLANAGHPPLLMRGADGRTSWLHAPPGPPLGLSMPDYQEIAVPFPPGSVLVGFTDGLVEARGVSLDRGLDTLAETLAGLPDVEDVEAIADKLLQCTGRAGGSDDDIALVVVRRTA